MTIDKLFPAGIKPESPDDIPVLLNNIIIMVNFLPGVRRRLRWRGVYRIPGDRECWTIKTGDYPGIFGIMYNTGFPHHGWISGLFHLYYFPAPDDPLLDLYSINAALMSQRIDYLAMVREFTSHPGMEEYFHIGCLTVMLSHDGRSLILGVDGQSRMRIQSVDGVYATVNGAQRQLIAPGEMEQDIPSYDLFFTLFETIASSVTYLADDTPCGFMKGEGEGLLTRYRSNGSLLHEKSTDTSRISLIAAYGDEVSCRAFITDTINGSDTGFTSTQWYRSENPVPRPLDTATWWTTAEKLNEKGTSADGKLSLPPLIILTGFLGSGKTSFIKHFTEHQMQKHRLTAVIQNEIGKTGLDGKLLSEECAVVEMDEGCVCCSLAGNLRLGMAKVMEEFDPDFIILETTGAANPMNLLDELDDISDIVRLDSIVTMLDAENIMDILEKFTVAADQIKAADIVMINKRDLVDEIAVERIISRIEEINPGTLIFETTDGNINPFQLFDEGVDEGFTKKTVADHKNHHTHVHDNLSAHTIVFSSPVDRNKFVQHIETVPPGVFRIKGVVRFSGDDQPWVIQYVGKRYTIERYTSRDTVDSFITIIGKNLDEEILNTHFNRFS